MFKSVIKSYGPHSILNFFVGRKRRVFALGTPKSGTTSIARMFADHCRADHEPHRPATVDDMYDHFNGVISDEQLRAEYRARDKRLLLDVESNCFLAYRPDILRSAFPETRFIITVRHPRNWLDSIFDNNINFPRNKTPTMKKWHSVLFCTDKEPRSPHCDFLLKRGLYPVDCYLAYWARTYDLCIRSLSNAQHLLIGTSQITKRTREIRNFVDEDFEVSDTGLSHENKTVAKHGILAQLDSSYVDESLNKFCQPLISEFGLAALWDDVSIPIA